MAEPSPETAEAPIFDWSKYPDEGLVYNILSALARAQTELRERTGKTHGTILKGNTRVIIPDQEPYKFRPRNKTGEQIAITLGEATIIRRETRAGKISLYFMIKDLVGGEKGGSQIVVHKYDGKENCFRLLTRPDMPESERAAMREELQGLYWKNWNSKDFQRMAKLEETLGPHTVSFNYLHLRSGEDLKPQWQRIVDVEKLGITPQQIEGNLLICTATRPFTVLTGARTQTA